MNFYSLQRTKKKLARQATMKRMQQIQEGQQDQQKNQLIVNQALYRGHLRIFRKVKSHLLACFNKKQPPNIDRKTGDHAANKGFNIPLTPRELKLKLKR